MEGRGYRRITTDTQSNRVTTDTRIATGWKVEDTQEGYWMEGRGYREQQNNN